MPVRSIGPSGARVALLTTLAVTAAAAALLLPSPGSAASSHTVKLTIREAGISETPGPAPDGPPSFVLEAGVLSGSLGQGANRTNLHLLEGKGTRELFTRQGTLRGSFVFGGEHKSDGDTIVGTFTITGGTGKYAGARGKLKIDGFHSNKTDISTEHLSGALTY